MRLVKDAPHQKYYTASGVGPLPSVSKICKIGDDPFGLIHWAWKQGKEGKDHNVEREKTSYAGDVAHAKISAYLMEQDLEIIGFTDEEIENGEISYKAFVPWWEKGQYRVIYSERQMVSEQYLFGGSLDILGITPEEKICLFDLKRVNNLRISNSIQVAGGYTILHDELEPDMPVEEVCLIQLPKEKKKRIKAQWLDSGNIPVYKKCFLANLGAYEAREIINKIDPIAIKDRARRYWSRKNRK